MIFDKSIILMTASIITISCFIAAPLNSIPSRVKLLPSIPYLTIYDNLTSTEFIDLRNRIGNELLAALTPGTGLESVKLQEVYLSENCIFAE